MPNREATSDQLGEAGNHFPLLRNALRVWTQAAPAIISEALTSDDPRSNPFGLLDGAQEESFKINEWSAVLNAIAETPQLRSQIEHSVGTLLWSSPVTARELGIPFLHKMLFDSEARAQERQLTETSFDDTYLPIERFLAAKELEYEAFMLLIGLHSDLTPLSIDDEYSIVEMSQDDLTLSAIRSNLIAIAYDQISKNEVGEFDIPPHYRHAIKRTVRFSKLIDAAPGRPESAKAFQGIYDGLRSALRALAAVTPCYVIPWPVQISEMGLRRNESRRLGGGHQIMRFDSPGAVLKADDADKLRRIWLHVSHPSFEAKNGALAIALDRLAALGSRATDEDRMLDVFIACEAFFNPPAARAELTFRLAMNAAMISGDIPLQWSPRVVYRFMKAAYNVRSAIIHGTPVKPGDLQIDGQPLTLAGFVAFTVHVVQTSIAWALTSFEPGSKVTIDWNDYYFRKRQDGGP